MFVAVGDPFHRHIDASPIRSEKRPLVDGLRSRIEHPLSHTQTIEQVQTFRGNEFATEFFAGEPALFQKQRAESRLR